MDYKKTAISVIAAIAIIGMFAFGGVMADSHSGTHIVDPNNESGNLDSDGYTYSSIQNATDNASSGETISIYNATYSENVTVTTENLTFEAYNASEPVEVDGTLNVTEVDDYTVGDNVTFAQIDTGDTQTGGVTVGDVTNALETRYFGVPGALWLILVIVVSAVLLKENGIGR